MKDPKNNIYTLNNSLVKWKDMNEFYQKLYIKKFN